MSKPVVKPHKCSQCGCQDCDTKDCPNVPRPARRSVSKKAKESCKGNTSKLKSGGVKKKDRDLPKTNRQSLLDMLNADENCMCEKMANALANRVHANLGLAHARDHINRTYDDSDDDIET